MGRSSCERQSHPFKPIVSTTNKHVEEAPAPPSRPDADAIWRAGDADVRPCPTSYMVGCQTLSTRAMRISAPPSSRPMT
jgi:hypothetical protein